jgi:hypothetical protein
MEQQFRWEVLYNHYVLHVGAQEASGSNPDAPTKSFTIRKLQERNVRTAAEWCNLGTMRRNRAENSHANFA